MSVKPDERALQCLLRLQQPEFAPLVGYLAALREEARDGLETADESRFRVKQGEARMLKRLLDEVGAARETLTKMQS